MKVGGNVEPEDISTDFFYCTAGKPSGLAPSLNGPCTQASLSSILHWSLGRCWFTQGHNFPNVNRFHHILFLQSLTLIPIDFIKSFTFGEAVKLKVADANVQNCHLHLKLQW